MQTSHCSTVVLVTNASKQINLPSPGSGRWMKGESAGYVLDESLLLRPPGKRRAQQMGQDELSLLCNNSTRPNRD